MLYVVIENGRLFFLLLWPSVKEPCDTISAGFFRVHGWPGPGSPASDVDVELSSRRGNVEDAEAPDWPAIIACFGVNDQTCKSPVTPRTEKKDQIGRYCTV